jgi:hypothetical protein
MCHACIVDFDTSRCRNSTDFLWDGGEASTLADGEDRSVEAREATFVEGMCPVAIRSRHVW